MLMYLLEILFVIVLLALLVAQNVRGVGRGVSFIAFALALVIVLASAVSGDARWQMAPAYLLLSILGLLLAKPSHSHVVVRSIGAGCGTLLVGVAVALSLALPIVTLPAPDGPYVVGSRSFSLVDGSRNEAYFGAPEALRELNVRVWYPGSFDPAEPPPRARTLWEDLYRGPRDPITMLTGYMRGIKTHTYEGIPLATAAGAHPVLVFSHSLGLGAEQNTPLMEHLASHGYVVIGVNHSRLTLRVVSLAGAHDFSGSREAPRSVRRRRGSRHGIAWRQCRACDLCRATRRHGICARRRGARDERASGDPRGRSAVRTGRH
jgi:predicted dienelactone hydrolase